MDRLDNVFIEQAVLGAVTLPASCVTDSQVAAGALIGAEKLQHSHVITYSIAGTLTTTITNLPIYTVFGQTGQVACLMVTAMTPPSGGNKQFTVDLKKANVSTTPTTMLIAPVAYTSSTAARSPISTYPTSVGSLAAGDILTLSVTPSGTTGTQAADVCIAVVVYEDPQ